MCRGPSNLHNKPASSLRDGGDRRTRQIPHPTAQGWVPKTEPQEPPHPGPHCLLAAIISSSQWERQVRWIREKPARASHAHPGLCFVPTWKDPFYSPPTQNVSLLKAQSNLASPQTSHQATPLPPRHSGAHAALAAGWKVCEGPLPRGCPCEQGPRRGPGCTWPTHCVCSMSVYRPKALGIPPKDIF